MERKYKYDDFARKGIYLYLYLWNIVREIMVIIKVLIIYIFYISIVILRFVLNGNSDWLFLRIRWSSRLDGDLKPLLDSLERAIGTPAAFPSWLKTSVVGFVGACFPFQPCSIATTDPHAVVLLLEDREGELEFLLRLENAP